MYNGYNFTKPTSTKEHLEALKADALMQGWSDIAAATDNLLDLLTRKAIRTGAESDITSTGLDRDGELTGISQDVIL